MTSSWTPERNHVDLISEVPSLPPAHSKAQIGEAALRQMERVIGVRWVAVLGQLTAIFVVRVLLDVELPLAELLAIVGLELAINLALRLWLRSKPVVRHWIIVASATADVLLFTALLYYTGGPFNPFFTLYLIYIALAVLVLRTTAARQVVAIALLCLVALFVHHRWLGIGWESRGAAHARAMDLHSQATWAAFAIAVAFIIYFARDVQRDFAQREREANEARVRTQSDEWLGSLAALTAGAAHELSGPLTTIAVVAGDLERDLGIGHRASANVADMHLIRREVQRCRSILAQMVADASRPDDVEAHTKILVSDLLTRLREELDGRGSMRVALDPTMAGLTIRIHARAALLALRNVVVNGWQAMPPGGEVAVSAAVTNDRLEITIEDSGSGMPPNVLAHASEPLFSTKPAGEGMGLGLFLTRAVLQRMGGALRLASRPGHGTVAVVELPIERQP